MFDMYGTYNSMPLRNYIMTYNKKRVQIMMGVASLAKYFVSTWQKDYYKNVLAAAHFTVDSGLPAIHYLQPTCVLLYVDHKILDLYF